MQKIILPPKVWIKRIQIIFLFLVFASLLLLIRQFWDEIQDINWRFNLLYMIFSIFIIVVTMIVWAATWSWLLSRVSTTPVNLKLGVSIYLYGNLAKYLPGSVWNYLARGYLGYQGGYKLQRIWYTSFIEFTLSISTGMIIYLISLRFPKKFQPIIPESIIFLVALILIFITSPLIIQNIQKWLSMLRKNPESANSELKLRWLDHLLFFIISIISWSIVGLAFCLFVNSTYPLPINYVPEVVGEFSLAIALGMAVLIIPQGMGVREGYLIMALQQLIPLPVAVTTALLSRFWVIAGELGAILFWWLFTRLFPDNLIKS